MAAVKYTPNGSTWPVLASGPQGQPGAMGPMSISRNRVINGDFAVNQREFGSINLEGQTFYIIDQWIGSAATTAASGGYASAWLLTVPTSGAVGLAEEARSYLRLTTSSQSLTGGFARFIHRIEDVRTLSGKTITVSFWVRSSVTNRKVGVELGQQFGSGGSAGVSVPFGYVTATTTWTRVSITKALPSLAGKTMGTESKLEVNLWTSAGASYAAYASSIGSQNQDMEFWGIQVEEGPAMTAYAYKPYAETLWQCQRYFQKWRQPPLNGTIGAPSLFSRMGMPLPATMYKNPQVASYGNMSALEHNSQISTFSGVSNNFSTTTVVEINANAASSFSDFFRTALVYQNGDSPYMDIVAEI